jgi:hypothetical protein
MDIWLEISACVEHLPRIILEQRTLGAIPSLSEVISAAQKASSKKQSEKWDYSLKISQEESDKIKATVNFGKRLEDERSIIFYEDISFSDSCYTLRLFIEKSQGSANP